MNKLQRLMGVLSLLSVVGTALAAKPGTGSNNVVAVTIDAKEAGAVISPQLFGHNLEVTRRAVWSGLGAEMVANRKFAAVDGTQPKRWQAVGGEGAVKIDKTLGYAGSKSVSVEVPAGGTPAGIKQQHEFLAVAQGKSYGFRIWVKTGKARQLKVVLAGDAGKVIAEKQLAAREGDWQLLEGKFKSAVTQVNCSLEITSVEAGPYWVGAVSLMPADNFHGMRRDVVERLKQLKPGCLRFPGGCFAEFYRWEDGLLPVDQRPPIGPTGLWFLLPNSDDYDTHEIGIDEFMALCREVGAEPGITVRLSENTPESAAAWVEYCNGDSRTKWGKIRAERGQKKPYGVRTWFLGNELYSFGRGGLNNPNICGKKTKLFGEAVRQVDPTIELVGCTDLVYGKIKAGWNNPLMEQAGSLLTYVSCHDYLRDSAHPRDIPSYAGAARGHLRPAFENIRKTLNKPVLFDEWNTIWGLPGSIQMGFCVAGVMNLLCREGDALNVKGAYYFQPVTEGAIKVAPLTAELDSAGYVFELFKVHQGNRAVKIAGDSTVDLSASLSPDRAKIYVTAVNSSSSEQVVMFRLAEGMKARKSTAAARYLVARSTKPSETAWDEKAETVAVVDGREMSVRLPPCSLAQIQLDIRKLPR